MYRATFWTIARRLTARQPRLAIRNPTASRASSAVAADRPAPCMRSGRTRHEGNGARTCTDHRHPSKRRTAPACAGGNASPMASGASAPIQSQTSRSPPQRRGAGALRPTAAARARPRRFSSMANKMLIDAAHPEETRVVVLRGNRVEEFDFESASRKQLRGNIYLAKVTRVEPSLQAAFVDYGGNRHGFLAFSEIHPDYYQIPVADRQALIEAEEARDRRSRSARRRARARRWRGRRGDDRPCGRRSGRVPPAIGEEAATGDRGRREAADASRATETTAGHGRRFGNAPSHGAHARDRRSHRRRRRPHRRRRRDGERRGSASTTTATAPTTTTAIEVVSDDAVEFGRRRGRAGGSAGAPQAARPPVQDPGSHQAPPGAARPGRQGRARQQGRGAHHLPLARRPLFGADAEHGARRRHLAARSPVVTDRKRLKQVVVRPRSAGGHGRHPPHRRRQPHQGRGQARLRISAAPLGERARADAALDRADPRLRGRLADQALDPRPLQQGHRRSRGRRRRRLPRGQGLHAHAHAEPCEEREALQGRRSRSSPAPASRRSSTRCSRRR